MTKTKQDNNPNEMSQAEKKARIFHLENKFYDINTTPSMLLMDEIEHVGMGHDATLLAAVRELSAMENHLVTLQQEYDTKITNELKPLVYGHAQQRSKMVRQHEQAIAYLRQNASPLRRLQIESTLQKQERELSELAKTQNAQKASLRNKLQEDLNSYKQKTFLKFMRFVHQIYK